MTDILTTFSRCCYLPWKSEYDSVSAQSRARLYVVTDRTIWYRAKHVLPVMPPTNLEFEGMENAWYPWFMDQTDFWAPVGILTPASACLQGWVPITTVTTVSDTQRPLLPSETAVRRCPKPVNPLTILSSISDLPLRCRFRRQEISGGFEQPATVTNSLWAYEMANDATT